MSNEDKIISLLEIVVSKIDTLEYKMDNLEYKFDNMEFKMDGTEYKVDSVDKKMEKTEIRQTQIRTEIFAEIEAFEERILKLQERHLHTMLENISRLESRILEAVSPEHSSLE
jgi:predicted  nucleic acid-binding Zn-ribbon protein